MSDIKTYRPMAGEVFHVHTYRCKHAEQIPDKAYVEKAIELGVPRIVFTDHAPFPGNPFGNRMDIDELPEYIYTMKELKSEYGNRIEVLAGLEVEFLPSYQKYYHELSHQSGLDLLILGQHFYEVEPGAYSFGNEDKTYEYVGLCKAMCQGIETNIFDVVAHPDRAFRRRKNFGGEETEVAQKLIKTASLYEVYLEMNYSSMQRKRQYWHEFWELLPRKTKIVYGIDAHSLDEMSEGMAEYYKVAGLFGQD